jgi:hypothetical protein
MFAVTGQCLSRRTEDVESHSSCRKADHPNVPATIEPCDFPDGIELVYADNRDRRHIIGLKDAAPLDFGSTKPFRKPPAYRTLSPRPPRP